MHVWAAEQAPSLNTDEALHHGGWLCAAGGQQGVDKGTPHPTPMDSATRLGEPLTRCLASQQSLRSELVPLCPLSPLQLNKFRKRYADDEALNTVSGRARCALCVALGVNDMCRSAGRVMSTLGP